MSFYASNPDVRVCFTVLNWSPQRLLEHIPTIHVFLGPYLRGEEVPSTEGWISFDDRLRRQILCLTGQLRSASAFSLSRDLGLHLPYRSKGDVIYVLKSFIMEGQSTEHFNLIPEDNNTDKMYSINRTSRKSVVIRAKQARLDESLQNNNDRR